MKLRTEEISKEEAQAHMEAVKADPNSQYRSDCSHCVAAWNFGLWETP